jgi:phosphoacetylglucosamine mutase
MLEQSWEVYAAQLANSSSNDEEILRTIEEIVKKESIDMGKPANIVYARDTR